MAAATALGKQAHRNMPTSEDDAEYEDYDQDNELGASDAVAANKQLLNGAGYDDDGEYEEEDAPGEDADLSDRDAEGEEDDAIFEQPAAVAPNSVEDADADGSDYEDAEGVGAVKVQPGMSYEDKDAPYAEPDGDSDTAEEISVYSSEESDADSDAESEDEIEVQSEQDLEVEEEPAEEPAEDEGLQALNPNCCVICNREEEDDPTGTPEEILCCAVCGDNAHRSCARTKGEFHPEEDPEKWRCKSCISNALEPEHANLALDSPTIQRRLSQLSTAPKLARDLLPSHRGAIKPDSHSVFANLILDDDPIDGSRHLRKRKTSSIEPEDRITSPKQKRPKRESGGRRSSSVVVEVEEPKQPAGELHVRHIMEKRSATPRPSRSLRAPKTADQAQATIEKTLRTSIMMKFRVDPQKLERVLSIPPKPKKKRSRPAPARPASPVAFNPAPAIYTPHYSQPFYPLIDKEVDETKAKPYGGILAEAEADTSKTLPQADERRLFDKSRQEADEKWKVKAAAEQALVETNKKRKVSGPASQIECINFGGFEIDTWYAAPYPEEYSCNRVLYICEFCLKYMNSEYVAWRHRMKCSAKCPPGDEIYREGSISMFEVDGRKHPVYCQNLCLLAKLFLGSKTLYYDVEPFLFYVMTESDEFGCHLVGYFSKEKRPSSQNNVSCILTLPIRQRKGYGNLLIDFSYLLTRVEKKSGSPEKPLSDMGLVSYRNYWRLVLCYQLRHTKGQREPISIADLTEKTGMTADDIVSALEGLRALVRDPVTKSYAVRLDYEFIEEYIQKWEDKKYVKLNADALVWTPYVMGRNNQHLLEHAPPLTAIAHPDEDETMEVPGQAATENGGRRTSSQVNGVAPQQAAQGVASANGIIEEEDRDHAEAALTNGTAKNSFSAPAAPAIPPHRYEVFPPITGPRQKGPRFSMSGAARPVATPRTAPARPRNSRQNSSRRAAATTRKTAPRARRPTGGTGRGPGRWPKGSKKSDFGNADSGPGLPPKGKKDDSDDEDDILYETPGMSRRRSGPPSRRGGKKVIESDDDDDMELVMGDVKA